MANHCNTGEIQPTSSSSSEMTNETISTASMTITEGENMATGIQEGQEDVDFDSPETQAVRVVYANLIEVFSHQVDELASKLYQEGLVGMNEYSSVVQTMGFSNRKRAVQLLLAVISMITVVPANFDKFAMVLETHQCFSEIVQIMRDRYQVLKEQELSTDIVPSRGPPLLTQRTMSIGEQELQVEFDVLEKRVEHMKKKVERQFQRAEMKKERELDLTRQEVVQLKQRLTEVEKQLAISTFQNEFFQEQLSKAQTQIEQLTREVINLKQQMPSCGVQCEHHTKCQLLEKDTEKLEELRLEHIAKIANLNAQIAYLLESSHHRSR